MKWSKEMWVMNILSDAQELSAMGRAKECRETINKAKRVLMGQYREVDGGFSIEVLSKKSAVDLSPETIKGLFQSQVEELTKKTMEVI